MRADVDREELELRTRDGWTLRGVRHRGTGRGVLLCGHAMMVSSSTFERGGMADALARRGFEVYRFDLRGHGRSRARDGRAVGWTYDDIVHGDLPVLVRGLRERHPGQALAIVGHSLVGHAALAWLGQEPDAPVDAVVALAANVWIPRLEPSRRRWLEKRSTLEAWLLAARLFGRFPARRFGLGSDDVALPYIRQFVGWARADAWRSLDGRDYLAGLARVAVPVLSVLGAADRILCAPDCGRRFAGHLRSAPVSLWEVGRGELPGLVPDHMRMVTDPRAAPLWERIAGWLEERLPGRA